MKEETKIKNKTVGVAVHGDPQTEIKNKSVGAGPASAHNEGITLIALIVTIIIMLILVAVTVKILIDSDLIGSTKTAANKWKNETGEEKTMGSKIVIDEVTYDSIEDYLNDIQSSDLKVKLKLEHEDKTVTADGTKVGSIVDGVPIPTGFVASGATGENTKEGGLVIYEGETAVNDSNVSEAQTTRNQFVWVPVLQNQKIKIEIKPEEEITEIKILDPKFNEITEDIDGNVINTNAINATIANGETYTVEIKPTINGTYKITTKTGDDEVTKTLKVSSLYAENIDFDERMIDDYIQAIMGQEATMMGYESIEEFIDSGVLEEYGYTYNDLVELIKEDVIRGMIDSKDLIVDEVIESVNKYGGFYVARYEAGCNDQPGSFNQYRGTAYSMRDKFPYTYLKYDKAVTKAAEMYADSTSVFSSMSNIAAWDRTVNWFLEEEKITNDDVTNSVNIGNYYDSKFKVNRGWIGMYDFDLISGEYNKKQESILFTTGATDRNAINNIYDMAGNCEEWALTNTNSTERYARDIRGWLFYYEFKRYRKSG